MSIVDNQFAGGGYSIYFGTGGGGPVLGSLEFGGNRISSYERGGYWGPTVLCPRGGIVWDENETPTS